MSIDATRWAWTVPVNNSSQRLVLLSLADRAGEEHTAWPSIDRLAKDTVLDKKTVQKVILELINLGLVEDTGERTGPTKRVRVLKLNGVKGREEYTQIQNDSNTPKNGNIKQSQKRNDSKNENDPKNGVQNLSENPSMNLSQEHDWIPDTDQLATKLKMAGYGNSLDSIFGLPSFEFELSAFNSHFDSQVLSNSKKLHKFTAWIIDKFERYKKANPNYVHQFQPNTVSTDQPIINLSDSKPKSLLGSM